MINQPDIGLHVYLEEKVNVITQMLGIGNLRVHIVRISVELSHTKVVSVPSIGISVNLSDEEDNDCIAWSS